MTFVSYFITDSVFISDPAPTEPTESTYSVFSSLHSGPFSPVSPSEPFFDATIPRNVTALVGKTAYLSCRVRNLGNRTVS